jgi:hypothetical protein
MPAIRLRTAGILFLLRVGGGETVLTAAAAAPRARS